MAKSCVSVVFCLLVVHGICAEEVWFDGWTWGMSQEEVRSIGHAPFWVDEDGRTHFVSEVYGMPAEAICYFGDNGLIGVWYRVPIVDDDSAAAVAEYWETEDVLCEYFPVGALSLSTLDAWLEDEDAWEDDAQLNAILRSDPGESYDLDAYLVLRSWRSTDGTVVYHSLDRPGGGTWHHWVRFEDVHAEKALLSWMPH